MSTMIDMPFGLDVEPPAIGSNQCISIFCVTIIGRSIGGIPYVNCFSSFFFHTDREIIAGV